MKEYLEKMKISCSSFTKNEEERLKKATYASKHLLRNTKKKFGPGFDPIKSSRIRIIFGCTSGRFYEGGMPHTRYPAIILNREQLSNLTDSELVSIIIHETIHLYQKKYPQDMERYLAKNNFEFVKTKNPSDNIRANPDTDGYIYRNRKTNKIYEYKYNVFPLAISDIMYNQEEHPFEEMAYQIENQISV
jgi:hypothetical protein